VRVQVPAEKTIAAVKLLEANVPVPYKMEGQTLVVEVPSILVHEVVAIDFVM
jgi:hypothetical protein